LSLKQFTDYQRNEQLFSVFPELNHNAQRVKKYLIEYFLKIIDDITIFASLIYNSSKQNIMQT